jgi:uncharacterized protein
LIFVTSPPPETPVLTDPLFLLLAIPAVTFLGLAKGGFSGVGMIATPLLALILPPLQAAAILLPILLLQDVISVWVYRKDYSAANLKVLMPGGAIGVAVAWALAAYVSDHHVRFAIGVIGVAFVLNAWFGRIPTDAKPASTFGGMFWGGLSGFTSTLSQAGAPPFQIYVLPLRLPKMTLVGTAAIFFAALNVMKVAPYFALGQFSTEGLVTTLGLTPLAIATNFLGIWLVQRTPTKLFYQIAYVLVFLICLALLWQGGRHILGL